MNVVLQKKYYLHKMTRSIQLVITRQHLRQFFFTSLEERSNCLEFFFDLALLKHIQVHEIKYSVDLKAFDYLTVYSKEGV